MLNRQDNKERILLLYGGCSPEHEVSLRSADFVYNTLKKLPQYEVFLCGGDKKGRWYLYEGDPAKIPDASWLKDKAALSEVYFSGNSERPGLLLKKNTENGNTLYKELFYDLVFPVMHGTGEDGTLQGMLELLRVPFVGCDMSASVISMNKVLTKERAKAAGIPVLPWLELRASEYFADPESFHEKAAEICSYPYFVKPVRCGSSVGTSKVHDLREAATAFQEAFKFDDLVMAEENADGRELELAVLSDRSEGFFMVSDPGEILPGAEFYDYRAKYLSAESKTLLKADVSDEIKEKLKEYAGKVFKINACSGLSRVDFFLRKKDSAIFFNEINTLPGFTAISMYPKMIEGMGLKAAEYMQKLIEDAKCRAKAL